MMNLAGHKLIASTPEHFEIHDGKSAFRVAKRGLDPSTAKAIEQHFSGDSGDPVDQVVQPGPSPLEALAKDPQTVKDNAEIAAATAANEQAAAANEQAANEGDITDSPLMARNRILNAAAVDAKLGVQPSPPLGSADVPLAQGKPQPPVIPGVGGSGAFDAGVRQEQLGIQERAGADTALAAQQARIQAQSVIDQQAAADKYKADMAANVARQNEVLNGVLSKKIDPHEWWTSKSTAGQIGSSIALALGGLGATLGRTPNFVLEQVNKQIDQDLEAQKDNIAQGNNMLSRYVQQGHDLQSAHAMAKADALDAVAAQMRQASAANGGQQAAAMADLQAGQLQSQAAQVRQDNALKSYGLANQKIAYRANVLDQSINDAKREMLGRYYAGTASDNDMAALMPPEQMATTHDGRRQWAGSPETAKLVNANTAAGLPLRQQIAQARTLLTRGSFLSPDDQATAGGLQQAMTTALNNYGGFKRWNTEQVAANQKNLVPNVDDWKSGINAKAKLDELERTLNQNDLGLESTLPGGYRGPLRVR